MLVLLVTVFAISEFLQVLRITVFSDERFLINLDHIPNNLVHNNEIYFWQIFYLALPCLILYMSVISANLS